MIVLDNSVFIAALFDDEKQAEAITLHQLILEGQTSAIAPPVFLYEACNTVMVSLRRRRISETASRHYLQMIYRFPLQTDAGQPMPKVVALAAKHALTIYDAAYLELCIRRRLPLATFDQALVRAAAKEKIALVMG